MNDIIPVSTSTFLSPAAALQTVLQAYQMKKEFIEKVLKPDVDFGTIPGSTKPALLKPGAEKMATYFGLTPVFEDVTAIEDWTGEVHGGEAFFYYRQKCKLFKGDWLIATADGSCNSWEKKYRYRQMQRACPVCGQETIFKSKQKDEFYCWAKKGGCGATFKLTDKRITEQEVGQVKNLDIAEQVNTILKMAQKRALIAAVLIATNVSDYFTQDIEDFIEGEIRDVTPPPAAPSAPEPPTAQWDAAFAEQHQAEPPKTAMTLEFAEAEMDRNGVRYGDIDSEKLAFMATELETTLKKKGLTEAAIDKAQRKLEAAKTILAHRNTK